MFVLRFLVVCFGVLIACVERSHALSTEETAMIQEALIPVVSECGSQFDMSVDEIRAAKKAGNVDALNPCLIACMFKKIGSLNENGLFDPEKGQEMFKKFIKNEEDLKKIAEISKDCESVNKEDVSDGEKGCDRAKLLFGCLMKHKGTFALNV